ncbi:MAG: NEW3 domain-containing protein [Thermoplasmata archaeon]
MVVPRRIWPVCAAAAALWLLSAPLPAASAGPCPEDSGSLERAQGLLWTRAETIASDFCPTPLSLISSSDGTQSLIWESGGVWHVLLDPQGRPLQSPKYLGPAAQELWASRGGAPQAARDSFGYIHFVHASGGTEIYLTSHDPSGRLPSVDRLVRSNPFGVHGPSIVAVGEGLLVGYVSFEPLAGRYLYLLQPLEFSGTPSGPPISFEAPGGAQVLDGAFLPSENGTVDLVLSTTSGGIYLRLGATGGVELSAHVPLLPAGTLPGIARDTDGCPVLAWNTGGPGEKGRIALGRHVGAGEGFDVILITGPAEAISDPSLAFGAGGELVVAWLDGRYGTPEALYAVLRAGEWRAYPPNLRLGPAACATSPPLLSVSAGGRLHAVWAEGPELRLARGLTAGFRIHGTGFPADEAVVHPHVASRIPVVVRSTGGAPETLLVRIEPSSVPAGWRAVPETSELFLPGDGTAVAIVLVTPPASASGGRAMLSVVISSASNSSLSRAVEIPLRLEVRHRVTALLEPSEQAAAPGSPARFVIELRNGGDSDEELEITASSGPLLSLSLDTSELIIHRGGTERRILTASPDPLAPPGSVLPFTLRFVTRSAGEAATLSGAVLVAPPVLLRIQPSASEAEVEPGGTADFNITVGNAGTLTGEVGAAVEVVSGSGGWAHSLSPNQLILAPGEDGMLRLTVRAPESTPGRFVARLWAFSREWGTSAGTTVTVSVRETHSLLAHAIPERPTARPGSALPVLLTLRNRGSAAEEARVGIELPPGWSAEFIGLPEPLLLGPGAELSFRVLVHTHPGALAGEYNLRAVFTAPSGARAEADFIAAVEEVFGVSLTTSSPVLRMAPGEVAVALVYLRNLGNAPDNVLLGVEAPEGWTAILRDAEMREVRGVSLEPRATAGLVLELRAPLAPGEGRPEIFVTAVSRGGLTERLGIVLRHLLPELSLSVRYSPDRFTEGRRVLAAVAVTNTGEVPARNVRVSLKVDGEGAQFEEILVLPGGSKATAYFTWRPTAGSHTLRFEVDPENAVVERDETNNVFIERVRIGGGPAAMPSIPAAAAAGAAAIALGALGALGAGTESGRYGLLSFLLVPLYTKIKRDDVLDHFVRGQVYGYIKANPGEHYNSIRKALSLKNGTLVYHLKTLERENFIKSVMDGRFRRFYPVEMKIPEPSDELVLRMTRIQRELLDIIAKNPGISQKEIASRIGLSAPTVHYHIDILTAARKIYVKRVGRETQCFATESEEAPAG